MRADTAIGPYRTAAPIDPDTWAVDGPGPTAEAHRVDGRPGPDFDQVAARLPAVSHPHLWPVLAAGRVEGRAWIVRPPVVGGTLADRLAAGHHPPYKVAIDVGVAVLRALGTAHQTGFAHGRLDAGSIAWSDGLRVVGVGYGALVGRPADAADDVRAVARLVHALVPEPPGELRALLAAPMPTADAFCRALKTLDPALSQDRDFDFDQPTPAATPPPPVVPAARPAPAAEVGSPQPESPADLPFEVAPASTPGEDGWGVEPPPEEERPPSRGAGWVVGSREMVEASTEDTWGVGASPATASGGPRPDGMRRDHTGAIVHTVTTAARPDDGSQSRNPWATAAVAVAVIAVVLVGARVAMNHLGGGEALPEPTVAAGQLAIDAGPFPDAAPATTARIDDGSIGDGAASDGAAGDGADAAGPRVVLLIGPVPGTVVRVEDSAVICEASRRCPVPIDVDYRIEAKGHVSQSVSGDDLYDRRRIGALERVLQPVPPKAPRERKRRRGR